MTAQAKGQSHTDQANPANYNLPETVTRQLTLAAERHSALVEAKRFRKQPIDTGRLEEAIEAIYRAISSKPDANRSATYSENWLLDNRHIIEDALANIRAGLPGAFQKELPLVAVEDVRTPRVLDLARILVAQGPSPIDIEWLERAVDVYQTGTSLGIGELWALPAALRVAILERLVEDAEAAFERQLNADVSQDHAERQIADKVGGDIVSLRNLDAHDWRKSFERLSHVDRILRLDPAETYAGMEFDSRNRYRSAIEELSRGSGKQESEVAEHVIEICRRHEPSSPDPRFGHAGYYLISAGRPTYEAALGFRHTFRTRLRRILLGHPGVIYFGTLATLTAAILAVFAGYLLSRGMWPLETAVVTLIVGIPAGGMSIAMLNRLVTGLVAPRSLPRMDFEAGIPADYRTAVVMPVMFASDEDVDDALAQIEINYLNNPDGQLIYAILSDWPDAPRQTMDGDDALLERAKAGIDELNARHRQTAGEDPVLLLHRRRLWNAAENCWMGWERKRGKLVEFNRLLAKRGDTSYETFIGSRDALSGVRFVITLDADTHMPPGTARRLVGTIVHPLNRAIIDDASGTVIAGYTILQPRLAIDPDSTLTTRFTEIFAGDTTLDLYTHASSDVYQDLFAEGIFAGKGLYDWQAFERLLSARVPENSLLSHDLLEGVHSGAALVSDIVLLEQYPSSALVFMRRLHRWVRGDWQLLPWLGPLVPTASGRWRRNRLAFIHQWKIIDNLRRSVQPPAVLGLLGLTWAGEVPGPAWLWTLVFASFLASPLISEIFEQLLRLVTNPRAAPEQLAELPHVLTERTEHCLLSLVLLPFESYVVLDAIVRTLFRLLVTRRRLLEWTTAAHVHRKLGAGSKSSLIWREMWISPAVAVTAAVAIAWLQPTVAAAAGPLLAAWLLAPQIISWVNRPLYGPPPPVTATDLRHMRRIARKTWLFFEHFVGPDDHWLPPDNYQEEPVAVLARRTSPTNIGMALCSSLAAYDLGYLNQALLGARIRNMFEGMARLQRHRGHWLNWYETRDLHPLEPEYVSTVDSGNLAASLIVVARGLDEVRDKPVYRPIVTKSIADTLDVLARTIEGASAGRHPRVRTLIEQLDNLSNDLTVARDAAEQRRNLAPLREGVSSITEGILRLVEDEDIVVGREELRHLRSWLDELNRQIDQAMSYFGTFQPWLAAFDDVSAEFRSSDGFDALRKRLNSRLTLVDLPGACDAAAKILDTLTGDNDIAAWAKQFAARLTDTRKTVIALLDEFHELANQADSWFEEMDFSFLYDNRRDLFRIGYGVTTGSLDPNYYDLLASEARLAGYIAIAKGDVPMKHWLHMARPFRRVDGTTVLMSWSATLFEYLMPVLFMATPRETLLGRACQSAVSLQQQFAERHHLPWGVSESGFYDLDEHQHYQYRAFGVPGLGFRRDLGERLVVAPYACIMALPIDASAVLRNLIKIESVAGLGLYGFFEAVDYGQSESSAPRRARVVRSYMSHHQGMALVALDNFLAGETMVRRFHGDRRLARISMLLHERLPRVPAVLPIPEQVAGVHAAAFESAVELQTSTVDDHARPQYSLLSNGHLNLLLNTHGGAGSWWDDYAIVPVHERPGCRDGGQWVYVKDRETGDTLTLGHHRPGQQAPYTVHFGPHIVAYHHREHKLFCQMDIAVASQHDVEVRKITIRNDATRSRKLLVASFAELALAPPAEYMRHPAFSRLFVESEYLEEERMLVYHRRSREPAERPIYFGYMPVMGRQPDQFGWETNRGAFLGRWGDPARPHALSNGAAALTGSTGAIVDPAIGTALEIEIAAGQTIEIALLAGVASSREQLLSTLRSYRSMARVNWIFQQARLQSEQELKDLRLTKNDASAMTDLLTATIMAQEGLRQPEDFHRDGPALQSALWSRGVSGDRPVILLDIAGGHDMPIAEQLIKIHTYLCARRWPVDLMLMDEESSGYAQQTRNRLEDAIDKVRSRTQRRLAGTAFIVPAKELPPDTREAFNAVAQVVLDTRHGDIETQLTHASRHGALLPPFVPVKSADWQPLKPPTLARPDNLVFDNGFGGFTPDGREYVIHLDGDSCPPAPWINVISNPDFGTLVSESGASCTWAGNSSEKRLTPWANDPVTDPSGEIIYIRDEETGKLWTATPRPIGSEGRYEVRHGMGYTEFRHTGPGVSGTYRVHVDPDEPVKVCRLALTNHAGWTRRMTVTCYIEWVLGTTRDTTAAHVTTDFASDSSALLARNRFSDITGAGVAFLTSSETPHGITTNRREFLGTGDSASPAALHRIGLSGDVSGSADPCAAYQIHINLPPGETRTVHFALGQGADAVEASALANKFRTLTEAETSFERSNGRWARLLECIQVATPEPAMDLIVNRWLLYQVVSSRLWGRTGYYQSSGAYGFRDQLQDVMALTWAAPELTRGHLVRAASRQFQEGDVLHWWHEAPLRGIRTRCSDDLLWLPYVAAHYVDTTGDESVLQEQVSYLVGPVLHREETERYAQYPVSNEQGSLYEHCCRAIDRAITVGPHGLPTIGSCDWNDGFNRIGTFGRGESVWLAWFLIRVCRDFAPICNLQNDSALAQHYDAIADDIESRVEDAAWDGEWYRRAYFDDGMPLGSASNTECQIDLIAQTWAILAREEPTPRARRAMDSANKHLVKEEDRLILLLTPPFDRAPRDPGYIKSYPPGIRENGGQYTHAATWAVQATAQLGDGNGAMSLFRLLNPALRTKTPEEVVRYQAEPYVLSGDIYSVAPHVGRGGWSWYTGAAGWLYRCSIESLLGLKRREDEIVLAPCLPADWTAFHVRLCRGKSVYHLDVTKPRGQCGDVAIVVDGKSVSGNRLPFVDDAREHHIEVRIESQEPHRFDHHPDF